MAELNVVHEVLYQVHEVKLRVYVLGLSSWLNLGRVGRDSLHEVSVPDKEDCDC